MKTTLALLGLLSASTAFGWGDLGHSSVGYIAEKHLSPSGKKFIYSIMGPEPLGISAIFPDQVRDDERYKAFAVYHFLEIPHGLSFKDIPADRFVARSANTIIEDVPRLTLLHKGKERLNIQQKQILLRYFIHVVGDVHQPLHVGNGLDRGGNYCDVKTVSGQKKNLHSVWDTTIPESMEKEALSATGTTFFNYRVFSDWLLAESEKSGQLQDLKELVKKTANLDWYAESQALHSDVYPDANPTLPQEREYCKIINPQSGEVVREADQTKVPKLSPEYMAKAKEIVKRRILLAGLRLADEINKLADKRGDKPLSPEAEAELFKKMMPESPAPRGPSSKIEGKKSVTLSNHYCEDGH